MPTLFLENHTEKTTAFLRHSQQLIEVQLTLIFDVEDKLFQLGTQDSFEVGTEGVDEREVFRFNEHEGAKVLHAMKDTICGPLCDLAVADWIVIADCYR